MIYGHCIYDIIPSISFISVGIFCISTVEVLLLTITPKIHFDTELLPKM